MCGGGGVGEKSGNFQEISLIKPFEWTRLGSLCLSKSGEVPRVVESV